ncbi:MAG: hypothetical protein BMS9Abin36_0806 [Gammaproteobacteria bacterium]|nr:MAG: hypothetical protein BMS9Abin36_0806 [Gammaproteobacteria bacterium]
MRAFKLLKYLYSTVEVDMVLTAIVIKISDDIGKLQFIGTGTILKSITSNPYRASRLALYYQNNSLGSGLWVKSDDKIHCLATKGISTHQLM